MDLILGSEETSEEFTALLRFGTIGSVATCLACTPLDVARHSAQAALLRKQPPPPGLAQVLRTGAEPGIRSLWCGLSPALARAALSPATFLLVYHWEKSYRDAVAAGISARAVQTALLQPFEFVRTLRQSQVLLGPTARVHYERSVFEIIANDGGRSLYRGLIPTLCRDVSFSAVFWSSYIGLRSATGSGDEDIFGEPVRPNLLHAAALSTGCAAAAAVVSQPFDVVKTKMQLNQQVLTDGEGYRRVRIARFFKTLSDTFRIAGLRGLWTGVLPRTICAAAGGLLLGPFFEFGELVARDCIKPLRKTLYLGEDPTRTIVHPRSTRAMFIDVK